MIDKRPDILGKAAGLAGAGIAAFERRKARSTPAVPPGDVTVSIPRTPGGKWTAGFGARDILPEKEIGSSHKYYVAGYRINNPATGMLDPQTARAVWLDDNSGYGGVLFIAVDCVGLLSHDVAVIRRRLEPLCAKVGCRSVNVFSTHDHAGIDTMGIWGPLPGTGRDLTFMRPLYDAVVDAAYDAVASRRDGKLYRGYSRADKGMQRDDRIPQVFSDRLSRLRFVPDDGGREIWLVNFASHSESLEGANSLVSSDFPHFIRDQIEQDAGADCLYCVGAIGGLIRMWGMDEDPVVSTEKVGRRLGELVCGCDNDEPLEPGLGFIRKEFFIPAENTVLIGAAKLNILPAHPYYTGEGRMGISLKTEMTLFEIGGQKILLVPGELFPELAYGGYLGSDESADGLPPEINPEPLCRIAADDDMVIVGLANDEIGYIPAPNDFHLHPTRPFIDGHRDRYDRRHYEETNSLGQFTACRIADAFYDIMSARGQFYKDR